MKIHTTLLSIISVVMATFFLASAAQARFLQTDPVGYEDGLNWYVYVANDPVNNTDPTGEQAAAACLGGPVPCGVGLTINAVGAAVAGIALLNESAGDKSGGGEGAIRADAEGRIQGDAKPDDVKSGVKIFNTPPTGENAGEVMQEIENLPGAEKSDTKQGPLGPVDVVTLPDGSRVIDRNSSSGPRTIETQNSDGKSKTKTRFPDDQLKK